MKMEADTGPAHQGMPRATKSWETVEGVPLKPLQGVWPYRYLGPPGLQENTSLLLSSTEFVAICYGGPRKLIEMPSRDPGFVWFCL